jgi:hypothetical protein
MLQLLCAAAGDEKVRVTGKRGTALRLAGVVMPMMREMFETRHQLDGPFVLDSSAFTATFGDEATPLEEGAGATIAWWRDR